MNHRASSRLNRREFLATTAGATTAIVASLSATRELRAAEEKRGAPDVRKGIIDTNVSLHRWPFRRLALDDTSALAAKLRERGVAQAWAGSFDALLHKDISGVNARLADDCRTTGGLLVPMGAINPMLPGWEEDLRRCAEMHAMPGIRLHPNYHGYTLSDPIFERVLALAGERNLVVQIAVSMEDSRTLHPLVNVPATDTAPLPELARKFPRVRLQLLNAFRTLRGQPIADLAGAGIRFEIATLEIVAGLENLLAQIDVDRVLFGSAAPFFYFESAQLKLKESLLTEAQLSAVSAENARKFIVPR